MSDQSYNEGYLQGLYDAFHDLEQWIDILSGQEYLEIFALYRHHLESVIVLKQEALNGGRTTFEPESISKKLLLEREG